MQKIDFTKSVLIIQDKLKTVVLLERMTKEVKTSANPFNGQELTSLIVESKSNYDKIIENGSIEKILKLLTADSIYVSQNISTIINILLSRQATHQIFYTKEVFDFFSLHRTIDILAKATDKLFFENPEIQTVDNLESGYILFKVLNDKSGVSLKDYRKIFDQFIELIDALNKIIYPGEDIEDAEILVLDSGSDINLGIKTAAETAKSLFFIFKEVWDFIVNKKHYENRLTNQSLFENLEVMKKIKEAEESGALTTDESKELLHTVKTRTSQLLDLNVLPKSIADKEVEISNMDLLLEYKEIKRLKE